MSVRPETSILSAAGTSTVLVTSLEKAHAGLGGSRPLWGNIIGCLNHRARARNFETVCLFRRVTSINGCRKTRRPSPRAEFCKNLRNLRGQNGCVKRRRSWPGDGLLSQKTARSGYLIDGSTTWADHMNEADARWNDCTHKERHRPLSCSCFYRGEMPSEVVGPWPYGKPEPHFRRALATASPR
jgi:hypothetical protein